MQSAREIYLALQYSDSARLHTHTHTHTHVYTQIHGYISASANYRPALTALNYTPYPHFTIRVNPSALILFSPPSCSPPCSFFHSESLSLGSEILSRPISKHLQALKSKLSPKQVQKKKKVKGVWEGESGGKTGATSHQHY